MKFPAKLAVLSAVFILTAVIFSVINGSILDMTGISDRISDAELIKAMLLIQEKNGDPAHDVLLAIKYIAASAVLAGGLVYMAVCLSVSFKKRRKNTSKRTKR